MTTDTSPTMARRRGRPRDPGVEDAALGAARSLLIEMGFAGCTIAAVAQRAGVGKGTIYLRWPDKQSLVADAIAESIVDVRCPDTGNVRDDLVALYDDVIEAFGGDRGPLLAAAVAELPRYPKLQALYEERVVVPVVTMLGEVIARGTRRCEIRKVHDLTVVSDMLFSPLVIRVMVWQQGIPAGFSEAVVDSLLDGLRPRS